MKDDLCILVATHKPYRMPKEAEYLPVQVGSAGKPDLGYQRDDTGENISSRNANFCELTGLYWAWKNLSCQYCGLVHYRRILKVEVSEIRRLLHEVDVLVPAPRRYFIETNYSQYVHAHHAQDLDVTREILSERHADYLAAYDVCMRRTYGHRFNMFVMRKDLMDDYCEWLFDVLFELERRLDISSYDPYSARVFGFVSERLLDVWLTTRGVAFRELPVANLESQNWPMKVIRFLKRKFISGRR